MNSNIGIAGHVSKQTQTTKNIKSYLQDEHPENENTCILKISKTNNQMLKITIKKRELIN